MVAVNFLLQVTTAPQYIPILLLILVALAIPIGALTVGRLLRRSVFDQAKLLPYECGVDPINDARSRLSIKYYTVAMLFLIFDVETIFLFPWAIIYDELAIFGLIEILIFMALLVVGYFYAWKRGALDWA
jgi:NADH-quinone oxidoreductase subunit A